MTYVYEDWMKYDHEPAKAKTFATHKMLLRGQSPDEITHEELVAEYNWALNVKDFAYVDQIARVNEYKIQEMQAGRKENGTYGMRYNHEHEMLLRGQSPDEITAGQLVAEYEYAAQIVRLMEFKNQQEVRAEKLAQTAAAKPKGKLVNRERVGDAARNRYSDHLATLYGQGYIDQEEFERLNDKALTAKTVSDLANLLTDLPPLPVPARPDVVVQRRRFMERRVSEVPFAVWGALATVLVFVCLLLVAVI